MVSPVLLPKLNRLQPTLYSTLWKAMEEAGELARAVLRFQDYQEVPLARMREGPAAQALQEVAEELLDVAQTCVTMLFVMEENYQLDLQIFLEKHLQKLKEKGYLYDQNIPYRLETVGQGKCLQLPQLQIPQVTLLTTVCKIQEELGELTQFLGKKAGASGEENVDAPQEILSGCAEELLDVAQCCFTMMYILAEQYQVETTQVVACHIAKLKRRGYCD